jgi:peptide/nickel transport system ATP-binding protein
MNNDSVLKVEDVSVEYKTRRGQVLATNRVSFELRKGEALALIGESGSGKTTLALALVRMLASSARVTEGRILYTRDSVTRNVLELSDKALRAFRWHDCAMVFQGAQNAFNPVLRIRDQFADTARAHGHSDKNWIQERTLELLKLVRLDPERVYNSYPHELSGGMRQRTLLALGVMLNPQVVILDEPTTALDILTQRAVIEVLKEMQRRLNFSIIFISHDLALAAEMADRVATMYAGEIIETGAVDQIFYECLHPYTLGLLRSVPKLSHGQDELVSIPGNPPNLIEPPSGCKFVESPVLEHYGDGHKAACWHTERVIEVRANIYKPSAVG